MLLVLATCGFHWIEGWNWFDSLYMVAITLTTIGYNEVHPLSHLGREFNLGVILVGVSLMALMFGSLTQMLLEFELHKVLGRRRQEREMERLKDHYIICGAGRVGLSAARELASKGVPLVLIETQTHRLHTQEGEDRWLSLQGDATNEAVLRQAGIERARGLVAATTTDAVNVYIVLTARGLNPKLRIIARAGEEAAEKHLLTAGADTIIAPHVFAGHRIVQNFLQPYVVEFLDATAGRNAGSQDLGLEQVAITAESGLAGHTLSSSQVRQKHGWIVLAILPRAGKMRLNPAPDQVLAVGDHLIVMGAPAELNGGTERG